MVMLAVEITNLGPG